MKDLDLIKTIAKKTMPLTQLTVYVDGRWVFASLANPVRTTLQQNFYLISTPFGLTSEGVFNAENNSFDGNPGDYVAEDKNQGVLSVVAASYYSRMFPSSQDIPNTPTSSKMLKNPNFITKTLGESVDQDSDKVLIGNKTFSLPSTQKKSVTIIDTPTGQAKVHYDSSGVAWSEPAYFDSDLSAMVELKVASVAKPKSNY